MSTVEDYLQSRLNKAGVFRAFPVSWTLERKDSGSHSVAFMFSIQQEWTGEEWGGEWPTGYFVRSDSWVIKKDGTLNEGAITSLRKAGLWDGNFESIQGAPPQVQVLLTVEVEQYKGEDRYKVAWINPNADKPEERGGGFKPADGNLLASLNQRFGSQIRAMGGQQPNGAPPAPPQPASAGAPPQPQPAAAGTPPAPPAPPTGDATDNESQVVPGVNVPF